MNVLDRLESKREKKKKQVTESNREKVKKNKIERNVSVLKHRKLKKRERESTARRTERPKLHGAEQTCSNNYLERKR